MLSDKVRIIALDFETTGLDPQSDEPIQIGILESDIHWNIIWWYQSLLHPKKPITELKSIVWFITGLTVEKLETAPDCEDIIGDISAFFWENTIIVGHNIWFDLEFLKRFFPSLKWKTSIDTFRLSQSLIHYAPSYALEVLVDTLKTKENFQSILEKFTPYLWDEENFHDAYYDSKLTLALFFYLLERINLLVSNYPSLEDFISRSDGSLTELFLKKGDKMDVPIVLPPLKKITAQNTQMLTWTYPLEINEEMNTNKYQVKNIWIKDLLSSLVTRKQIILAFSNKSKLDIAKNILADLWIKNIGFVKEDQTLNSENLSLFVNKNKFSENELYFLLKYFSHAEQGLWILDLNTKWDFEIYTALRDQRSTVEYPIILATHWWLFSLLEQKEKYEGYEIVFFDLEWWYKSYNYYLSRAYDLNYTLNYLDMLSYKFSLQYELWRQEKENLDKFEEFRQFFTMFIGILGQETKVFFTNTDATVQTIDPLKWNISFYQTNKLLERFDEWKEIIQWLLQPSEFTMLWKQIDHMNTIFDNIMIVEKKMWWRKWEFYFVYSEEVKFTNWNDFLEELKGHNTIFLSNTDETLPELIHVDEKQENALDDKIFPLSKTPSVVKAIENFDFENNPNWCIFVLSVKKDESVALFEEFIGKWFDKQYLLLVENITWGVGKNLFKAKQQWAKIIIWGYNFLLQLFAQKIAISQLIIYNNKWNQQDLIFSDIIWYGKQALL